LFPVPVMCFFFFFSFFFSHSFLCFLRNYLESVSSLFFSWFFSVNFLFHNIMSLRILNSSLSLINKIVFSSLDSWYSSD
jgi:hypothetical protein